MVGAKPLIPNQALLPPMNYLNVMQALVLPLSVVQSSRSVQGNLYVVFVFVFGGKATRVSLEQIFLKEESSL